MTTQCAEYVDYQLPKNFNCVNCLLGAIECKNTVLNAAIEIVKGEKNSTGKTYKLKYAAAHLTPRYPVAKNQNTNRKRGAAETSNTSTRGAQVSATGAKQERGSTWFDLRCYKYD